jgi:hypothetical protein
VTGTVTRKGLLAGIASLASAAACTPSRAQTTSERRYESLPGVLKAQAERGLKRYHPLPAAMRAQLARVEPSGDLDLRYYPCRVRLRSGDVLDRVYLAEAISWFEMWGVWPDQDQAKTELLIENVAEIQDSPSRLPARFGNEIYRAGESGMGYSVFRVLFADGSNMVVGTGGAVDFVSYPSGKGPSDVVGVRPHEGRGEPMAEHVDYAWCLFTE